MSFCSIETGRDNSCNTTSLSFFHSSLISLPPSSSTFPLFTTSQSTPSISFNPHSSDNRWCFIKYWWNLCFSFFACSFFFTLLFHFLDISLRYFFSLNCNAIHVSRLNMLFFFCVTLSFTFLLVKESIMDYSVHSREVLCESWKRWRYWW